MICYFEIFPKLSPVLISLTFLCVSVSVLVATSCFTLLMYLSCAVYQVWFPVLSFSLIVFICASFFPAVFTNRHYPVFYLNSLPYFFPFALWTSSTTSVKSVFCVKICLPLESVFGSLNCIPIFLFQHKSRVITSCQSPKEIFFEMLCFFFLFSSFVFLPAFMLLSLVYCL